MKLWRNLGLLPRLLSGILLFVALVAAVILIDHMRQERELGEQRAQAMLRQTAVFMLPTIVEHSVLGDYVSIKQDLQTQAKLRPEILQLMWRDGYGASVLGTDTAPVNNIAPSWFVNWLGLAAQKLTIPLEYSGQQYGDMTMTFNPAVKNNQLWQDFRRYIGFVLVGMVAISLFVYTVLRRGLMTIRRLVAAVGEMQSGNYQFTVLEQGSPDVRALVRAFNEGNLRLGRLIKDLHKRDLLQVEQLEEISTKNFALQEQHRAVSAAAILVETDLAGNITYVNDKFVLLSGYTHEALLGKHHRMMNSAAHSSAFFATLWATIGRGQVWHGELCNRTQQGGVYWLDVTIVPILDEKTRQPLRYKAICFDISARKMLESSLYLEKERAEVTLSSIGDAVLTTDVHGNINFINQVAEQLTGWSLADAQGQAVENVFNIVNEDSRVRVENPARQALREGTVVALANHTVLIARHGAEYNIEDSAAPIFMSDGRLLGCVLVFHDVTDKHKLMRAVRWQAGHDTLTNLPNRALLNEQFARSLANARRNNTLSAVCLLDLDEFKPINDTYGHEIGDKVLVEIAHRLNLAMRGDDTVARLGGDEFVLLLNDFRAISEIEIALRRIMQAVAQPCAVGSIAMSVNASIGLTVYPLDDVDADTLMRHADQAMYQAKQAGRNRYYLFDLDNDLATRTSLERIQRVKEALQNNELVLFYQPKVNMRTGEIQGMEALLRWQHPELGLVLPLDFLPLVEQTDLIVAIGEWVIAQALRQISAWLAMGKQWEISVNIAGLHFQRLDFCQRLAMILANHADVPPHLLEIEILESATVGDLHCAHTTIIGCQALGVRFALDDFGTGYSSLSYLKHLPVNVLKIDQSFVRDILIDKSGVALTEAVIGLASVFNCEVIAEGVETREHSAMLLRLGCDYGQGYGIARPIPVAQVLAWADAWQAEGGWQAGYESV
ncbi:MAG: EAL domain-containing protein [Sulfuriferula sp.]|nr:EAL domain-containing protein [Sulfuriferula sp.]